MALGDLWVGILAWCNYSFGIYMICGIYMTHGKGWKGSPLWSPYSSGVRCRNMSRCVIMAAIIRTVTMIKQLYSPVWFCGKWFCEVIQEKITAFSTSSLVQVVCAVRHFVTPSSALQKSCKANITMNSFIPLRPLHTTYHTWWDQMSEMLLSSLSEQLATQQSTLRWVILPTVLLYYRTTAVWCPGSNNYIYCSIIFILITALSLILFPLSFGRGISQNYTHLIWGLIWMLLKILFRNIIRNTTKLCTE